ncbi:hypothetical protein VZT92_009282 [Zoarces viviparus]|uniref:Uncharacterized protein n=1 Tax=Zoarces viviparus TaxID=48416 RepID=A0AAW1FHB2_ZOAVI
MSSALVPPAPPPLYPLLLTHEINHLMTPPKPTDESFWDTFGVRDTNGCLPFTPPLRGRNSSRDSGGRRRASAVAPLTTSLSSRNPEIQT